MKVFNWYLHSRIDPDKYQRFRKCLKIQRMSDRKQNQPTDSTLMILYTVKVFKHTQEEKAETAENSKYLALKILFEITTVYT